MNCLVEESFIIVIWCKAVDMNFIMMHNVKDFFRTQNLLLRDLKNTFVTSFTKHQTNLKIFLQDTFDLVNISSYTDALCKKKTFFKVTF